MTHSLDTSGKAEAACETACIALAPPTAVLVSPNRFSLFCLSLVLLVAISLSLFLAL